MFHICELSEPCQNAVSPEQTVTDTGSSSVSELVQCPRCSSSLLSAALVAASCCSPGLSVASGLFHPLPRSDPGPQLPRLSKYLRPAPSPCFSSMYLLWLIEWDWVSSRLNVITGVTKKNVCSCHQSGTKHTHTRSHPLLNILTKKKVCPTNTELRRQKKSSCFHLFQHIVCISSCWTCTCEPPASALSSDLAACLAVHQSVPPLQSVAAAVGMIVSWNSSTEISGDSDFRCKDLPPAPAGWDLAERQLDYSLSLHTGHLAECEGGGGCVCVCVFRNKIWFQNQHLLTVCFVYF